MGTGSRDGGQEKLTERLLCAFCRSAARTARGHLALYFTSLELACSAASEWVPFCGASQQIDCSRVRCDEARKERGCSRLWIWRLRTDQESTSPHGASSI